MFICISLFFLNRGDSMALIKINKKTFTFLFVITLVLAAAIPFSSALTKPSVTLPADWELTEETPYPEEMSEHDPEGSGMVQYQNNINFDGVMIYYEDSLSITYTNNQLKSEVENIFERDHEGDFDESGIMTVAGVSAGYAKAYDQEYDAYILELVFVKGSYYINAYAFYDANTASEKSVMTLLNSIGGTTSPSPTQSGGTTSPPPTQTPSGLLSGTNLLIIIGLIVAVVVVVVVILVVKKKRPAQVPQQNYIPPPPPTY